MAKMKRRSRSQSFTRGPMGLSLHFAILLSLSSSLITCVADTAQSINAGEQAILIGASFWEENQGISIAMIVVASCLLFIILLGRCLYHISRKHRIQKEKRFTLGIFRYLKDFQVENLDIRRSAAGGFHVSYKNELEEGIDGSKDDSNSTVGSSDSLANGDPRKHLSSRV